MHVGAGQVQGHGHLLQGESELLARASLREPCFDSCRQYYTGEAVAPYPTIFVGGNHEASNYLWEVRRVGEAEV